MFMKINTDNWKQFEFPKIFRIEKGFYNKKPESSGTGEIPFLGATDSNNGVTGYYTLDEIESSSKTGNEPNEPLNRKIFSGKALCVTNNGSVGYAYYQENQFTCSHDVNPLYRIEGEFNIYTGLFVASIIMKDRYRWGYGRKWRPDRMKKSKILLPAKENGEPDWLWMENFIKKLNCKAISTNFKNNTKFKLDTLLWEEFFCINFSIFQWEMESIQTKQQILIQNLIMYLGTVMEMEL